MSRDERSTGRRDAFDEPPGPRQLDLAAMDPGDFEEIAHRLVRVTYPTSRHTGNPDSGADTVLPKDGARGWERAWQARRYETHTWNADQVEAARNPGNLVTVIDAAATIQEWTGERIPMPERFADDGTIGPLLAAAATIRAGGQRGRAAGMRCTLADGADIPERGPAGITMVLQEEVGYEIAGRVVWLGCIAWLVSDVDWTVETDAEGRTVLVAAADDATPVIGMLHRGKLKDLPVPDDFKAFELHRVE